MTTRPGLAWLAALAVLTPTCAWTQQPARLPTVAILSDGMAVSCASGLAGHAVACMVDALRVAVIVSPDNLLLAGNLARLDAAASRVGMTLVRFDARNATELPQALVAVAASGADAAFMFDEGPLAGNVDVRRQVGNWAVNRRLPLDSSNTSFAADGALVSLGADIAAIARSATFYLYRILGGARPADLPVEQPTNFELVISLKAANALGITIPRFILLRADRVIQ